MSYEMCSLRCAERLYPIRILSHGARGYTSAQPSRSPTTDDMKRHFEALEINRIFILEKITKYDIERKNGLNDHEIRTRFPLAYKTHMTHVGIMDYLLRQLNERFKIHTIVVKAQSHNLSIIDTELSAFPPDLIISAGGDGTFLEAASLVPPKGPYAKPLWIVGINTDPERSMGALCLSYFNEHNAFFKRPHPALEKGGNDTCISSKQKMIRFNIKTDAPREECTSDSIGEKEWSDISGASFGGINQLADSSAPDHCTVISKNDSNVYSLTYDEYIGNLLDRLLTKRECKPICRQKIRIKVFKRHNPAASNEETLTKDSANIEEILFDGTESNFNPDELTTKNMVKGKIRAPYGAVNDVIVADRSFGKTFYALVQVDNSPIMRVKSSGVLVTTGTGSTAWAYNMCKESLSHGMQLFKKLLYHPDFPQDAVSKVTPKMMQEAIESHNEDLVFGASSKNLKCIIREGIQDLSTVEHSSFTGRQVKLLSLSKNAELFIDGSKTIKVDYGDVVVLKTFDSDVIWSCV